MLPVGGTTKGQVGPPQNSGWVGSPGRGPLLCCGRCRGFAPGDVVRRPPSSVLSMSLCPVYLSDCTSPPPHPPTQSIWISPPPHTHTELTPPVVLYSHRPAFPLPALCYIVLLLLVLQRSSSKASLGSVGPWGLGGGGLGGGGMVIHTSAPSTGPLPRGAGGRGQMKLKAVGILNVLADRPPAQRNRDWGPKQRLAELHCAHTRGHALC